MKTSVKSVANHRDFIKRKKRLKKELKLIILKSFLQNKNYSPSIRSFIRFKLMVLFKKNFSLSYQQNICIFSGKKKSTFKISNMSRQLTKRFIENGLIQGIKIK